MTYHANNRFNFDPMKNWGQPIGIDAASSNSLMPVQGGDLTSGWSDAMNTPSILGNASNTGVGKGSIWSNFLQQKDGSGGYGAAGLGILQGLGNAYMGSQQLKVAKASLAEGKRQFDLNYGAQKQSTNNALEGRRREMNAAQGNGPELESVASYMNRNGIK